MADEQTPVEIKILVDEAVPFVAEDKTPDIAAETSQKLRRIAGRSTLAAQRMWRSDTRKRISDGLVRGSATVVAKSNRFLRERLAKSAERQMRQQASAVRERVQSTDWKQEAKTTTASSLRWLSQRLANLADRFTTVKDSAAEERADTPGGS